jgi:hypothetical protein
MLKQFLSTRSNLGQLETLIEQVLKDINFIRNELHSSESESRNTEVSGLTRKSHEAILSDEREFVALLERLSFEASHLAAELKQPVTETSGPVFVHHYGSFDVESSYFSLPIAFSRERKAWLARSLRRDTGATSLCLWQPLVRHDELFSTIEALAITGSLQLLTHVPPESMLRKVMRDDKDSDFEGFDIWISICAFPRTGHEIYYPDRQADPSKLFAPWIQHSLLLDTAYDPHSQGTLNRRMMLISKINAYFKSGGRDRDEQLESRFDDLYPETCH